MTDEPMTTQLGFHALPLPLAQLSLAAVLKCGQSFRWSIYPLHAALPSDPSHEYRLCLQDRVVCLRQSPDTLFYRAVFPDTSVPPETVSARDSETLQWLKDYFQLDVDLIKLYGDWAERDPVFAKLRARFEGIRMLRQDPWENLISFICSSNNNIARITKMVKSLCNQYSPPLLSIPPPKTMFATGLLTPPTDSNDSCPSSALATPEPELETFHPFPPPSWLSTPDVSATLRSLGFGYRADFIQKTAKMLVDAHGVCPLSAGGVEGPEKWLDTLRSMSTADAREELLKLMGVGRKVADCILLMSLDKAEVIPVDTHVHQIATKHYGFRGMSGTKQAMSPKLYEAISERFHSIWGDYAGWAHSVLFTADLKAFSDYGLTPEPSPKKQDATIYRTSGGPSSAPTHSARKRSAKRVQTQGAPTLGEGLRTDDDNPAGASSLAERVKKRRRVQQVPR